MAKDVVDRIVERDGGKARCRTDEIPLGSAPVRRAAATRSPRPPPRLGLDERRRRRRWSADRRARTRVLGLVAADPALGQPLSPAAPHIAAEVVHAARCEGAVTLDDVFSRRMRLSLRAKDARCRPRRWPPACWRAETGRDDAWAAAQVERLRRRGASRARRARPGRRAGRAQRDRLGQTTRLQRVDRRSAREVLARGLQRRGHVRRRHVGVEVGLVAPATRW